MVHVISCTVTEVLAKLKKSVQDTVTHEDEQPERAATHRPPQEEKCGHPGIAICTKHKLQLPELRTARQYSYHSRVLTRCPRRSGGWSPATARARGPPAACTR